MKIHHIILFVLLSACTSRSNEVPLSASAIHSHDQFFVYIPLEGHKFSKNDIQFHHEAETAIPMNDKGQTLVEERAPIYIKLTSLNNTYQYICYPADYFTSAEYGTNTIRFPIDNEEYNFLITYKKDRVILKIDINSINYGCVAPIAEQKFDSKVYVRIKSDTKSEEHTLNINYIVPHYEGLWFNANGD